MSIEGLMKNPIQSAMELVDRMKQGTDGMRFADYQLNNNKVFLTKLHLLMHLTDYKQYANKVVLEVETYRKNKKSNKNYPLTQTKLYTTIREWSKYTTQDADLMRRGVQSPAIDKHLIPGDTATINYVNRGKQMKITDLTEDGRIVKG